MTEDGKAYCWGGRVLGDGTNDGESVTPVAMSAPTEEPGETPAG